MKRRSILTAVIFSTAALIAPLSKADALDNILKNKVLRVAVPQDFPPFGSVGADLKPVGYDIDMARAIAKDMGVTLELVPVSSANRIPYLTTRSARGCWISARLTHPSSARCSA